MLDLMNYSISLSARAAYIEAGRQSCLQRDAGYSENPRTLQSTVPRPFGSMKTLCATLSILLFTTATFSQNYLLTHGADIPAVCCYFYTSKPVICKFLLGYFETSSQCSKPGIIFKIKRGRQVWLICANPNETWVQDTLVQCTSWIGYARSPGDFGVPMKQGTKRQINHLIPMDTSPLDWEVYNHMLGHLHDD